MNYLQSSLSPVRATGDLSHEGSFAQTSSAFIVHPYVVAILTLSVVWTHAAYGEKP